MTDEEKQETQKKTNIFFYQCMQQAVMLAGAGEELGFALVVYPAGQPHRGNVICNQSNGDTSDAFDVASRRLRSGAFGVGGCPTERLDG